MGEPEKCRNCLKIMEIGCIISDVERAIYRGEDVPTCPHSSDPVNQPNQRPPESQKISIKASSINEKTSSINENKKYKTVSGSATSSFHPSSSSMMSKVDGRFLNERDLKILKLLSIGYHERGIARLKNEKRPTIQSIVKKLRELKLIKPVGKSNVRSYPKFYYATPKGMKFLEYNERETRNQELPPLSCHCNSFKFQAEGILPTSDRPIKMTHWIAYDFHYPNHKIRTIPGKKNNLIIVFVNHDLGADTVENLNHKYEELAKKYAREFSQEHGLKVGLPQRYKKPHYTIKNSAVAKKLTEQGEFRIESNGGLEIFDRSRSEGDRETTDEEKARQWENALYQIPKEFPKVRTEVHELEDRLSNTVSEIQEKIKRQDQAIITQGQAILHIQERELSKHSGEKYESQARNEKSKPEPVLEGYG